MAAVSVTLDRRSWFALENYAAGYGAALIALGRDNEPETWAELVEYLVQQKLGFQMTEPELAEIHDRTDIDALKALSQEGLGSAVRYVIELAGYLPAEAP